MEIKIAWNYIAILYIEVYNIVFFIMKINTFFQNNVFYS